MLLIQLFVEGIVMAKQQTQNRHVQRVYVKVDACFDNTGFMHPRIITWPDGRVFAVDSVKDFRPASTVGVSLSGDCYTVMIRGQEKHLFFERSDPLFPSRIGRWFVETQG